VDASLRDRDPGYRQGSRTVVAKSVAARIRLEPHDIEVRMAIPICRKDRRGRQPDTRPRLFRRRCWRFRRLKAAIERNENGASPRSTAMRELIAARPTSACPPKTRGRQASLWEFARR